ncbi:fungal-specific transcription factor domain-containing protein [Myxozyma melibiosi]|uniref:Fungal-specific transcription factor domain-containing protein n=1 Tax=Myxozyma melibiosi TaxID=54550 RepID=A0ABR1FDD5_9ASCO
MSSVPDSALAGQTQQQLHAPAAAAPSSTHGTPTTTPSRPNPGRKHRPGLTRIQVACEYCRRRKQKCDGAVPACNTCVKTNKECVYPDRLTYRQYPRGYVENLEEKVRSLEAQLRASRERNRNESEGANSESPSVQSPPDDDAGTESLIADVGYLSLEGASERRYLGSSSGVHFARILQSTFKWSDSSRAQNSTLPFDGRVESVSYSSELPPAIDALPNRASAETLADSFFATRWPQHPFIHRPHFFVNQFENTFMMNDVKAPSSDTFITLMILAIGAIDMRKLKIRHQYEPLQYYQTAMEYHIDALIAGDDLQSIQGLILLTMFAINEPRSLNVWHVVGIMIRMCIDMGLHRQPSSSIPLYQREIRKRIFWCAYIFDRSVSLALGRPVTIADSDINVDLPLNLSDDDLLRISEEQQDWSPQAIQRRDSQLSIPSKPPSPLDMSAFLHIIRLRQLNAEIQLNFYPARPENIQSPAVAEEKRKSIRKSLEEWIRSAPVYTLQTQSTFQSTEWFQIAYHNSQILLHRPSPAIPTPTLDSMKTCYVSSVSLINAYVALYSQNRVTYTWVALLGLFMASVTMLYTLCSSAEIRAMTNSETVEQNIRSSISLFEAMSDMWPIANRCIFVIESLSPRTLAMFNQQLQQDQQQQHQQTASAPLSSSLPHQPLSDPIPSSAQSNMSVSPMGTAYAQEHIMAQSTVLPIDTHVYQAGSDGVGPIKEEPLMENPQMMNNWYGNDSVNVYKTNYDTGLVDNSVYVPTSGDINMAHDPLAHTDHYPDLAMHALYQTNPVPNAMAGRMPTTNNLPASQYGPMGFDGVLTDSNGNPVIDMGYLNSLFDIAS